MHRDVFGYLMKSPARFCILNFPFKISLLEKLYQTLITVLHHNIKTSNLSKILRYVSYFQLSSWCLICDEHCVSCLIYYMKHVTVCTFSKQGHHHHLHHHHHRHHHQHHYHHHHHLHPSHHCHS